MSFDSDFSSSTYRGSLHSGKHELTIEGYYILRGRGAGTHIDSPPFSAGGRQFQILFYPDGISVDYSDFVSLYIKMLGNSPSPITVWLEYYLLDRFGDRWVVTNNTDPLLKLEADQCFQQGPLTMNSIDCMQGFSDYYPRNLLEASDLLRNDRLTLQCCVTIAKTPTSASELTPPSDLKESLRRLFENGKDKDVSFTVNGEILHAHKSVLSNRSDYFRVVFYGELKKEDEIITVEDTQAPIFKAMLRYIYCDDLPGYDTVTMLNLMAAADRYLIAPLKTLCENQLCDNISVDNVASCLGVADELNCKVLKASCFWFISNPENTRGVIKTIAMNNLASRSPSLMLELIQFLSEKTTSTAY